VPALTDPLDEGAPMTVPYLALALGGRHLLELAASPDLLLRWDELPLGLTVLGLDRVDGAAPRSSTVDSSAAAAVLARRTDRARFLIVATPQRDHPYNLARRVASLGHLSGGRSGVLFGVRDGYAPTGPAGAEAWGGAALGVGAPLTATTAYDAALAVRSLEQGWPFASIIGDRESGILVRSDQIVHADLDGAFTIAGPLNAPEPPTGSSVIAWLAADAADAAVRRAERDTAGQVVDLVIGPGGDLPVVSALDEPAPAGAAGLVLRAADEEGLEAVLDRVEHGLDAFRPVPPGPLRPALGLRAAARVAGERAAFPVPQPHPSL
jgi:hypothetical protein